MMYKRLEKDPDDFSQPKNLHSESLEMHNLGTIFII